MADPLTSVSVDLGDFGGDDDVVFLEIFSSANVSLGLTEFHQAAGFAGMTTLTLSAADIAYAMFGARDTGNGSTVFADNFSYQPQAVPEPQMLLMLCSRVGPGGRAPDSRARQSIAGPQRRKASQPGKALSPIQRQASLENLTTEIPTE